jgi:hypothetical protein
VWIAGEDGPEPRPTLRRLGRPHDVADALTTIKDDVVVVGPFIVVGFGRTHTSQHMCNFDCRLWLIPVDLRRSGQGFGGESVADWRDLSRRCLMSAIGT